MSTKTATIAATPDVKEVGLLTKYLSRAFSVLSPIERQEMLSDAAILSAGALGKAEDLMGRRADAGAATVEDQWDGPPDDHLPVRHVGGPGTKHPGGGELVGSTEAASGRGAQEMERTYSRPAQQGGVQTATERLGRDLMKAMSLILEAVKAQNQQIALLSVAKAGEEEEEEEEEEGEKALRAQIASAKSPAVKAALTKALQLMKGEDGEEEEEEEEEEGEKALRAQIAKAKTPVARKSLQKALKALKAARLAKAEGGEEEEEEEEEAEKALRAQLAGATTSAQRNTIRKAIALLKGEEITMEEEEEEAGEEKAVRTLRKRAREHLAKAESLLASMVEAKTARKAVTASRLAAEARSELGKAMDLTDMALEMNPNSKINTPMLIKAIKRAAENLPTDQAMNQDKWPVSKGTETGGGAGGSQGQDLAKAAAAIQEAVSGFGMLQANMKQVMEAAGGVSKSANGLPPVFELVKSNPEGETSSRFAKIDAFIDSGVLSETDGDRARDALMRMKAAAEGKLDSTIAMSALEKTVNRLPSIVQRDVFGQAA